MHFQILPFPPTTFPALSTFTFLAEMAEVRVILFKSPYLSACCHMYKPSKNCTKRQEEHFHILYFGIRKDILWGFFILQSIKQVTHHHGTKAKSLKTFLILKYSSLLMQPYLCTTGGTKAPPPTLRPCVCWSWEEMGRRGNKAKQQHSFYYCWRMVHLNS